MAGTSVYSVPAKPMDYWTLHHHHSTPDICHRLCYYIRTPSNNNTIHSGYFGSSLPIMEADMPPLLQVAKGNHFHHFYQNKGVNKTHFTRSIRRRQTPGRIGSLKHTRDWAETQAIVLSSSTKLVASADWDHHRPLLLIWMGAPNKSPIQQYLDLLAGMI